MLKSETASELVWLLSVFPVFLELNGFLVSNLNGTNCVIGLLELDGPVSDVLAYESYRLAIARVI